MLVSLSINSLEMYSRDISVIEIAHESNEANGVKGHPDTSKERLCCKAKFAHQHKAKSRCPLRLATTRPLIRPRNP